MLKILIAVAFLTGCNKVIEDGHADPKPEAEKHLHDISVKCQLEVSEPKLTEMSAFPIECPAGEVSRGITRQGGLWKLSCMSQKVVCETCIDGVCIPSLEEED